jgi:hypothetical protein
MTKTKLKVLWRLDQLLSSTDASRLTAMMTMLHKGEPVVGLAVANDWPMSSSRSCDEDEGEAEAEVAGDDVDALTSGGATTVERRASGC